jgi:hypothetical protein
LTFSGKLEDPEPMTLEELKDCAGFTVQVLLNGSPDLAQIESRFSADGLPHLSCPPSPGSWSRLLLLPITEDVAAKMSRNGDRNLFSTIHLIRESEDVARYAE